MDEEDDEEEDEALPDAAPAGGEPDGSGAGDGSSEGGMSDVSVQCHLALPAALSCRVASLFKQLFTLYASLHDAESEVESAERGQGEEERGGPPGVAGVVAKAIQKSLPTVVDFASKQLMAGPALMDLVADTPPHATPLVLRMERLLADRTLAKVGSVGSPVAKQCYEAAKRLKKARAGDDVRYIIPWLGVAEDADIFGYLAKLMPVIDPKADRGPGAPLRVAEFEAALRAIVSAVGKPNSDAAATRAATAVSWVVGFVTDLEKPPAPLKFVLNAFAVLCTTPVVGVMALQRALLGLSRTNPCPALLSRLLLEAIRQHPNLGQFVCNDVLPALVANQIWLERERWKGFLLLAKQYAVEKPPHCLELLLKLPHKQLRDVTKIAPASKGPLINYAKRHAGAPEVIGLSDESRKLLGI